MRKHTFFQNRLNF